MSGESTNENVELPGEQSSPPTDEQQMWIKRLWLWLFGHPKRVVPLRDGCKMTRSEFQQILIERQSELRKKPDPELRRKAEEKRQEGLRSIAIMNCNSGVGPLDLLPEEIWLAILKKLTPEDRLNLCHVHQAFHGLLKSALIRETLFALVLDYKIHLIKMSWVKSITGYPYLCEIPRPYYDRPQKDDLKQLTNLRLVSRSSRDAIDKWFEDRLLYVMRNPKARDGRDALNTVEMNLWENRSDLLEAGIPQRLILRSLSVDFTYEGERFMDEPLDNLGVRLRILKETFNELLDSVGDQLWHFHVCLDDFDYESEGESVHSLRPWQSVEQVGNIIRAWLLEMPNLKWLVINARSFEVRGSLNGPMPRLDELERFDVDGANMIPIANAIVSANPNIKIHSRSPSYHNGTIQYLSPPVLALPLECVHISGQLTMPQPVPDNNWNLKRIELRMFGGWDSTEIIHSMDNIFRFIQKFPALEDVGLSVDCVRIGEEINFLRLPNLKDFVIEFGPTVEYSGECGFFFSLQFLLHCKNLRKLMWDNRMQDSRPIRNFMNNVGEREGIWMDFLEEHHNVNEANVWDLFPHLRYIRVCYGRRELREGREVSVGYQWGYGRFPRTASRDNDFWSVLWVALAIWSLFSF